MAEKKYSQEFIDAFALFSSGSIETAWTNLVYECKFEKDLNGDAVTPELIITKWTEYIGACRTNGTAAQYTKHMSNFIEDKYYLSQSFSTSTKADNIVKTWLQGL